MKNCIIIPWFNYWKTDNKKEFNVLKNSLIKQINKVDIFDYESRPNDLNELLENLNKLIKTKSGEIILIGFSMGSYIILKYLEKYNNKNIKKIILTVPAIGGSKFFRICYKLWPNFKKYTKNLIYNCAYDNLYNIKLNKTIKVGIISGKKRFNRHFFYCLLAQLFLGFKKNDGLLLLSETNFQNSKKIILNIGHHESPYSKKVIDNIIKFIKTNEFEN